MAHTRLRCQDQAGMVRKARHAQPSWRRWSQTRASPLHRPIELFSVVNRTSTTPSGDPYATKLSCLVGATKPGCVRSRTNDGRCVSSWASFSARSIAARLLPTSMTCVCQPMARSWSRHLCLFLRHRPQQDAGRQCSFHPVMPLRLGWPDQNS